MKIKSIEINNFQSHEHTNIDLHPGVNVIIGRSDVGKSSILRAINWVLNNKPSGQGFVSHWDSKYTRVRLDFEDGPLTRVRGKDFNGYVLRTDKFKGFGLTVPQEISDFLNINELNTQFQFDPPFMLSPTWSPGERGAFLNKLVDLEITDLAAKNIRSSIREDNNKISTAENEIEELNERLGEYDYLEDLETKVKILEKWSTRLDNHKKSILDLSHTILEMEIAGVLVEENAHVPKLLKDLKSLETKATSLEFLSKSCADLKQHINNIKRCLDTTDRLKDTPKFKRSIKKIGVDIREYENAQKTRANLFSFVDEIDALKELIKELEVSKQYHEEQFHELMPERCPLCGK